MTIDECFEKVEYYLDEAATTSASVNLYLDKCHRLADAYMKFAETMILRENPVSFRKQGPL